jgi:hypothetical protein
MRPAIIFSVDGHVIRKVSGEWDGTALIEKGRRRKYIVMSSPYIMTEKAGFGTKAVNVFFASTQTATTWDVATMNKFVEDLRKLGAPKKGEPTEEEPQGATIPPPNWVNVITDVDILTGVKQPYRVTPEYIFEQSESSDIRAWNQQQATSKMMLWLAGGAGAAGMVMLYFVFQLVKGTSFFGG